MKKINKKKNSYNFFYFINMVVTFFGVGNMKLCPGTWGSIATLPFWIFINFVFLLLGISYSAVLTIIMWFLLLGGLFSLGVWASNIYMKENNNNNDPSEIVIDEVVGQMLTFVITTITFIIVSYFKADVLMGKFSNFFAIIWLLTLLLIIPIALFRVFDILKPWFIGKIDKKMKDGLGVMMDDILAGIVAGILSSLLVIKFLV